MNIKHRVHRARYIDWNAMDDDFDQYTDELMTDRANRKRKRTYRADSRDSGIKGRERHRPRRDEESDH
jgi:hypothetical protein